MAKGKTPRARKIFRATVIIAPLFALACLLFVFTLSRRMETGLLDVCANQQDGYVELVLKQINLKENRDDAELVSQIIGTLDASPNKYWTLSSDQTILFVKDVLETNQFKGVTTSTYYVSESARAFIENLPSNRAAHDLITIDDREYVASGVSFTYQGKQYSLCLLTNRDVLLESNVYLGVKTQLWIVFLLVLGLVVIVPFAMALQLLRAQEREDGDQRTIAVMGKRIEQMNERLTSMDLYDSRNNLWREDMLPRFLRALEARQAAPVTFIRVHCEAAEDRTRFLSLAHYTLDNTCLRVALEENDLFLIFVGAGRDAALLSTLPCLSRTAQIATTEAVEGPDGGGIVPAARRALQLPERFTSGRDVQ